MDYPIIFVEVPYMRDIRTWTLESEDHLKAILEGSQISRSGYFDWCEDNGYPGEMSYTLEAYTSWLRSDLQALWVRSKEEDNLPNTQAKISGTKMKHTKEPWYKEGFVIKGGKKEPICSLAYPDGARTRGNTELIICSPLLLKALKGLLSCAELNQEDLEENTLDLLDEANRLIFRIEGDR